MKPEAIRVIPRRYRARGEVVLFLPDSPCASPAMIGCYAHVGQHSEGSRAYYQAYTVPADLREPDVAELLREYAQLGVPAELKILRRMPR